VLPGDELVKLRPAKLAFASITFKPWFCHHHAVFYFPFKYIKPGKAANPLGAEGTNSAAAEKKKLSHWLKTSSGAAEAAIKRVHWILDFTSFSSLTRPPQLKYTVDSCCATRLVVRKHASCFGSMDPSVSCTASIG
jgi:hypothetical protein